MKSFLVALVALWATSAFSSDDSKVPAGMVLVPAGEYLPFYNSKKDQVKDQSKLKTVPVASFYMDIYPVTNEQFLTFVRTHPQWRRSRAKKIFAETGYLKHWKGDLQLGPDSPGNSPVVNVSWFAARAYCREIGKDLPTVDQWEFAASAVEEGTKDKETFHQRIMSWYAKPSQFPLPKVGSVYKNEFGIYDLHGLIWEWTSDFNTAMISNDTRGDAQDDKSLFCGAGSMNAADAKDFAAFQRFGMRSSLKGNYTVNNLGFRCAQGLPAKGS